MAGSYDGSIRINTAINTDSLDNGLAKIESKINSLGAAIGLAFGVKELIDFGKKAVTAASDLAEAQNVVDTAFGDMSYKMEQFASTALETYGISELTAKNMGSTYMAMAKGMGVATDAASDMAVTLTGRLSDIMSFYNKTQSEVDTIGRSLITGETEPLKAIGIVMTQTNLSAYAMAQGFAKAYDEMSSSEQLLVRYKYFLEQTAMAQGDFAKTSEGWANQTRLLSERLNEFMTNLGSLLINTLTPALQFANEAVSFLNELFFGGNDNAENATAVKNAESVTDEVTSMGTAADKSAKKLNNLIAGFDELHIISGAKSDKDDTAIDAGIDTSNLLGVNLDADTSVAKKAAKKYRDVINEIYLAFKRHPLTKAVEDIIKSVGKFFGFIEDNNKLSAGDVVTALMDILGAILAYKAVTKIVGGISAFVKGFSGLIGVITKHPVLAAAAGITALAFALVKLDSELERQRIAESFGDIVISLEEIDELVSPITADSDRVANAFENNKQKFKDVRDNFLNISEAVDKTAKSFHNASIKQDVEGFAKQLDEFVESALELNNAIYDTSDLETLFMSDGVIDDEERQILDELTELGGEVSNKIQSYAEEIHKITQAAIDENRQLTESEIENLEGLYKKLASLTAQQSDIKSTATWERLKNGEYTADSYAELAEKIKEAQEQDKKSRDEIEQANYEKIFSVAASMKANGKSDAEIEAFKEKEIKNVKESLREMELKSLRDQRDVLGAWGSAAFKDMIGTNTVLDDNKKDLMSAYFRAKLAAPEGVDIEKLWYTLTLDRGNKDGVYTLSQAEESALEKIRKHFGVDLMDEWNRLNEAIGDTGGSVEDFYDSMEYILKNTKGLEADNIFPKLEEIKEYPEEWVEVINEIIGNAEIDPVTLTLIFNTDEAEKRLDEYIQSKQLKKSAEKIFGSLHDYSKIINPQYEPSKTSINPEIYKYSPYISPEYYPTNKSTDDIVLTIVMDGEEKYKGSATGNLTATRSDNDWKVNNGW